MAHFLRSPRVDNGARKGAHNLSSYVRDGETIYVHSTPLVAHDACVPAEHAQRSAELQAEWDAAKLAVRVDHASRGETNPRTGEGWEYPSPDTPREIVDRLNAAGRAANAYESPVSVLAGAGWDWCWSPVYSLDPETAPPCYYCGAKCDGKG